MKVKELIEKLSVLDQDKDICIYYDMYATIEPKIIQADQVDENINDVGDGKLKKGDYYMPAW